MFCGYSSKISIGDNVGSESESVKQEDEEC